MFYIKKKKKKKKREREGVTLVYLHINTQMKYTERGEIDGTLWVHSFNQEICVYVHVTVYTPEK